MIDANDVVEKPTLLVVDDQPDNIMAVSGILKGTYRVKAATSGEKALTIATSDTPPDLILLDIMMPHMDGYEVCRRLKDNPVTASIPVIFLTAKSETQDEQYGLELGAVDYITKPISPPIVLARVENHLALKSYAEFMLERGNYLEKEVKNQRKQQNDQLDLTTLLLFAITDMRDTDSPNHIIRIKSIVDILVKQLQHSPYAEQITPTLAQLIPQASAFHDIGKCVVPDKVLFADQALDIEQYEKMTRHTYQGREAIARAEKALGTQHELLTIAKDIIGSHHERWDGSGFPDGLSREDIPLPARIVAVADAYDGMTSRTGGQELSSSQAVERLVTLGGQQYDPVIIESLVSKQTTIEQEISKLNDTDEDIERIKRGR